MRQWFWKEPSPAQVATEGWLALWCVRDSRIDGINSCIASCCGSALNDCNGRTPIFGTMLKPKRLIMLGYLCDRRGGFTLVELVVALALGAMLMAALVGILKSVDQQLDVMRLEARDNWTVSVSDVLSNDLLLATRISSSDGWTWLDGTFQDFESSSNTVRRVGYRCVAGVMEQQSVLVRWADGRVDPLVFGPRRLLVERLDATGTPQPLSSFSVSISPIVRVWITMEDGVSVFTRDFVLH